jgi:hypothetical protein
MFNKGDMVKLVSTDGSAITGYDVYIGQMFIVNKVAVDTLESLQLTLRREFIYVRVNSCITKDLPEMMSDQPFFAYNFRLVARKTDFGYIHV